MRGWLSAFQLPPSNPTVPSAGLPSCICPDQPFDHVIILPKEGTLRGQSGPSRLIGLQPLLATGLLSLKKTLEDALRHRGLVHHKECFQHQNKCKEEQVES